MTKKINYFDRNLSVSYDEYYLHLQNKANTLDTDQELNKFLAKVERKAFRIAEMSTSNKDDALEIVQEAMFKLADKYSNKPAEEWGPLFNKILNSKINDFHRRNFVRNKYRSWLGYNSEENGQDMIQSMEDEKIRNPEQLASSDERIDVLETALRALPPRQKQVFFLRVWDGLDVRDTAKAMSCSEGSVKTHFSRAVHTLRKTLGEHWYE